MFARKPTREGGIRSSYKDVCELGSEFVGILMFMMLELDSISCEGKYEENRKHGFGKMIYRRGVDREFSDLRLNTSHRMKKAMM